MNKTVKYLLIALAAMVILWSGMFVTDYICCASLTEPVFVIPGITADDGGSGTYYGLGYTVEIEKRLDVDYGVCIESVEMRFLGKIIAASIT